MLPYRLMTQARATVLVGQGAGPRPLRPRLTAEVAAQRCASAMEGVASTQVHAHVPSTVDRRRKCASEFQEFLDVLPEEWGVGLDTVGPEHVLWYAQEHWLASHTGKLPGGWHACAWQ